MLIYYCILCAEVRLGKERVMKSRILIACLLLVALFSTTAYAAGDDDGQIIENPWATYFEVSNYKKSDEPSEWRYPSKYGKIFAGWYTDESCETPYKARSGSAYAKFVDEKVLTIKFQKKTDGTAVRFLSSVDSINYNAVGFTFSGTYGDRTIQETSRNVTQVFKHITANNQTLDPTVFSPNSQYFSMFTIRKLDAQISSTWDVTPYWITLDGTTVKGPSRHYEMNN